MEREDIENSLKVLSHIVDDDFVITVDEARKIIGIDGETIEALQAEVEELKRVNMELFDDLPKYGEQIAHWISVKERLPEPIHPTDPRYKAYLICDSLGYMRVADYTYSKYFPTCYSFHVNGEEETDVKYWMPIEPPKEGE